MTQTEPRNEAGSPTLLWRLNDQRANKEGHHAKVYWVKTQKKSEDGSNHRSQWKFSHSYQGDWSNNIKSGFGIQFYENGDKYEGEWSNNCRNGFGTFWVKNEKKKLVRSYTGQYLNDQKHGKGTMFFENGCRFDGHWEANAIAGFGRMIYANGDVYVGNWKHNMRHGYGVFTKLNGDHYEGSWLMDKREGFGTFLFAANGKVIVGEWTDDTPRTSVLYKLDRKEKEAEGEGKGGLLRSPMMKKRVASDQNELNIKFNNMILPLLQLESPVEVLEEGMREVKRQRLGFRVAHSPLETLVTETELEVRAREWRGLMGDLSTATFADLRQFLDVGDPQVEAEALQELGVDEQEVYFEDFVRLIVFRDTLRELEE